MYGLEGGGALRYRDGTLGVTHREHIAPETAHCDAEEIVRNGSEGGVYPRGRERNKQDHGRRNLPHRPQSGASSSEKRVSGAAFTLPMMDDGAGREYVTP